MTLSSEPRKRWVIQDVEQDTPLLARFIAATYGVRIGEVIDLALYWMEERLEDGSELPEGWRDIRRA